MEKISVIVPIFKAEQYLVRCLESIIAQTYNNLQIILVDDGSPDNSGIMCDSYATKDVRIKVIHQLNSGVSSARNAGLDNASGKYILFVDADDYLPKNAIESYYKYIGEDADWYVGNFIICGDKFELSSYKSEKVAREIGLKNIYQGTYFARYYPWGKLYKADIINSNQIRYDVSLNWSEDFLFNLQYVYYVRKAVIIPERVYTYCKHNDSLSSKFRIDVWRTRYDWYLKYCKLLVTNPRLSQIYSLSDALWDQIVVAVTNGSLGTYREARSIIQEMLTNPEVKAALARPTNVKWDQRPLAFLLKYHLVTLGIFYCKAGRGLKQKALRIYRKYAWVK